MVALESPDADITTGGPVKLALDDVASLARRLWESFLGRCIHRFIRMEGIDRSLVLSSQAFTALIPLLILVSALASPGGRDAVAGTIITKFGLSGESAASVEELFEVSIGAQTTLGFTSAVLLLYSGVSFTRRLQKMFRAAWNQEKGGVRSNLFATLGLFVFLVEVLLLYGIMTLVRDLQVSWWLVLVLSALVGLVPWTSIPYLLLDRRIHWRRLLVAGALTSAAMAIYSTATTFYMPESSSWTTRSSSGSSASRSPSSAGCSGRPGSSSPVRRSVRSSTSPRSPGPCGSSGACASKTQWFRNRNRWPHSVRTDQFARCLRISERDRASHPIRMSRRGPLRPRLVPQPALRGGKNVSETLRPGDADMSAHTHGYGARQEVEPTSMSGWVGWIAFAGIMMVLLGTFHIIDGLIALFRDEYFLVTQSGLAVEADFTTWGWVHLIGGIIVLAAGIGVFTGMVWARTVGVIVALVSAVINVGFLSAYPIWSTIMIALDVLVIWALTVHGGELRE